MALAVKKQPIADKNFQSKKQSKQVVSKAKTATSKKVINFFKEQAKRRKDPLTELQREDLVLEFRVKARKLARSVLRKWHARLDIQEVDSIVDLSLCEAVRRFDPTVGASFMTFLFYHLKGNLIRTVTTAAQASGYGLSDDLRYHDDLYYIGGQAINSQEVAQALTGTENLAPDEALFKKELLELSASAKTNLDQLEAQIIERLYIAQEPLLEIADSLGYSRCHVSRVKKRALKVMKKEIESKLNFDSTSDIKNRTKKVYRRKPRSKVAKQSATYREKGARLKLVSNL